MYKIEKKKILIAVAWPYVNGDLHIGHYAGYLLPADLSARFHRLLGRDVLMVSGSDCFGTPITVEADKLSKHPREIVETYHQRDVDLMKTLQLTYDLYTKTDTENHKKLTQEIFVRMMDDGYIFKDKSKQYYSDTEKRFLPDRYVEGKCPKCGYEGARSDQCDKCGAVLDQGELVNPISKITKTPVSLKETEHYFLDWAKLQNFLEFYVGDPKLHSLGWRDWVLAETRGWLRQGLKPRAITRDLDWGVELPSERIPGTLKIENMENKRIYVWFDAVIGYLSASIEWAESNKDDWKRFWYGKEITHYYFMGKDNLIFHTLFWPGQLHVYDPELHLPDFHAINQFLNLEGQKFSKSRGVIIDTKYIVEKYGNDAVRFYLCLIMPEDADSNFSWSDFCDKVNNVLIGNIGNLFNRVLTLAKDVDFSNYSVDDVSSRERHTAFSSMEDVENIVNETFSSTHESLEYCRYKSYLTSVISLSSFANYFMSIRTPWKHKESNKEWFEKSMFNLMIMVVELAYLLVPLLPNATQKIFLDLGLNLPKSWPSKNEDFLEYFCELVKGVKVQNASPLFAKIDLLDMDEEKKKLPSQS